jgi:hypothetical protein
VNIDATVSYSAAEGLTVASGPTAGGIEVTHSPTKAEPWTDITVTIRTTGQVVIGAPPDPIETDAEAHAGELDEARRQRDWVRAQCERLERELNEARKQIVAVTERAEACKRERDDAIERGQVLSRELDDARALAELRGENLTRCEGERRHTLAQVAASYKRLT